MDGWMDGWIHILQRIPPRRWHKIDRYGYGSPIYLYHYFYRNASCLSNSWASCCILQCYYIGNGAKYDKSYYCSFIGNRIRRFDWRPWRTLKDDINGLKGYCVCYGKRMKSVRAVLFRFSEQETQLSQRDRALLRVIEYFTKPLKVTQGHSKWHPWVRRV